MAEIEGERGLIAHPEHAVQETLGDVRLELQQVLGVQNELPLVRLHALDDLAQGLRRQRLIEVEIHQIQAVNGDLFGESPHFRFF